MISFKTGVHTIWSPELDKISLAAQHVYGKYNKDVVITSGNDGRHMANSLHYKYKALDMRTWHLDGQPNPCLADAEMGQQCRKVIADLKSYLGVNYDVVFETDLFKDGEQIRYQHIHIEHDPKPKP